MIERSIAPHLQYHSYVPVYDLVASAGGWGDEGSPQQIGWIKVQDQPLSKDLFAAKVIGRSMEPTIPSESWCLFRSFTGGTRQDRLLLLQVNTHLDPEDGGRYTVKKYKSQKQATADGWEHVSITLQTTKPSIQSDRANRS